MDDNQDLINLLEQDEQAEASVALPEPPGEPQEGASPAGVPRLELLPSRQFPEWLAERETSLAFTTYQAGKIFFVGLQENGRLSVFERTLERCMGLALGENSLYVATLYQIWRFENLLGPGQTAEGYDRIFTPRLGYVTGDLDVHDMALAGDGRLLFVNTLFGCLATTSETHSFQPLWRPPFLSKLAAEDRCHLNGLALRDGEPAYMTAVAATDVADGWRDHRRGGGCVIDVAQNEVIARGLSMPHSPRWYRDRLWLHNSGTGEFGHLDLASGRFEPLCFAPGYLRGLSFVGDYAVMGLSKPRENKTFSGLPLDDAMAERGAVPRCALHVVDLRSGDCVHWLRIEGVVEELYDVVTLPGVRRPQAVGFKSDEIRRVISIG
jgi:uncharacterized protein (TIGR03032 family)